jgi:hypothetical protein
MTKPRIAAAFGLGLGVLVAVGCSDDASTAASGDAGPSSTPDSSTADTSVADGSSVADTSIADTSVADAGPTSYGCNLVVDGGGHTCTDSVYTNIPKSLFETSKTQCTMLTGTVVTACDHTGAVGGCTKTEVKNGITAVTTTWQYAGTVSSVMAVCASAAEGPWTFILP